MKFYLSSFKIGNEAATLKRLVPADCPRLAYIPNALDYSTDAARFAAHCDGDLRSLAEWGLQATLLDLRQYFGMKSALQGRLSGLGGLWISGGNTFVLRQAMRLSGLDELLTRNPLRSDFLYAGYSAAGCVAGPSLRPYQIVDDPGQRPYAECREVIWEGLGLVDFSFMPHYKSDHSESADIDKEIEYCENHGLPYRTVQDGEVIVIE